MTWEYSFHVHGVRFPDVGLFVCEFASPMLEVFQFWLPNSSLFVEVFVSGTDFLTSDWFPSEGCASWLITGQVTWFFEFFYSSSHISYLLCTGQRSIQGCLAPWIRLLLEASTTSCQVPFVKAFAAAIHPSARLTPWVVGIIVHVTSTR